MAKTMIKKGMSNREVHSMMYKKKKTQPDSMGNDSLHMPKRARANDNDADDAMKKVKAKKKSFTIKHSGTFEGKSNRLGQGGRAAQMRAHGVPGGVIGAIARREQAAPGQKNFHKRSR